MGRSSSAAPSDDLDLARLLEDPTRVAALAPDRVPTLLACIAAEQHHLAALQSAVIAWWLTSRSHEAPEGEDRLVDVVEAARLLQMSPAWLYRNADTLPFTRRVGARSLRFSTAGIRHYLAPRRPR